MNNNPTTRFPDLVVAILNSMDFSVLNSYFHEVSSFSYDGQTYTTSPADGKLICTSDPHHKFDTNSVIQGAFLCKLTKLHYPETSIYSQAVLHYEELNLCHQHRR